MKKISYLFCLIMIIFIACNKDEGYIYEFNYYVRYSIIVNSNVPKFRIDQTTLDSSKTYPYTLYDNTEKGTEKTALFTVYPVKDSGYIRLSLYGGIKAGYPDLVFLKSLKLTTPIDTTYIRMQFNSEEGTLTTVKNPN